MSEITTEQIKQLRDDTGISIMQCKKALEEAGGDMEKAKVMLSKKSRAAADKKSDRELNSGTVASYIHAGGSVGAMIELLCETDFVAKNEDFQKLAYDLAMQVAAVAPEYRTVDDINDEARAKATEVFKEEVADKPEEMQAQILEGKLAAYFGEKVLLEQSFVKNPDKKVKTMLDEATQKFGEKIELSRYDRFSI
jgi:elongation factor Ts